MKVFAEAIDASVLRFFTRISHAIQRLTGVTSYFIAYVFLSLILVDGMILLTNYWVRILDYPSNILDMIAIFFTFLFAIIFGPSLMEADKSSLNPIRALPIMQILVQESISLYVRIFWILTTLIVLPIFLRVITHPQQDFLFFRGFHYISPLFQLCFWYFAAVVPLPPSVNRVREWLNVMSAFFGRTSSAEARNR